MTESQNEIYRLLLDMQEAIHQNHKETTQELEIVRQTVFERIYPIEKKIERHDNIINFVTKCFTYLVPSGTAVAIITWLATLHK